MNYYSIYQKGNESERHYMLKQISRYVAFKMGYKICGEEIDLFSTNEFGYKNKADLVAAKMNNTYDRKEPKIDFICIEAKQSKQDYLNGFVSGADFNYVITQKGLLEEKDLLNGVGLIEVDFDKLNFNFDDKYKSNAEIVKGFCITKRAIRNKNCNIHRIDLLRHIAYRNTFETLFVRHGIMERK